MAKTVYRFAPCPAYDVEGMESWLTDLAAEGLILTKDGLWGGLAVLERSKPQQLHYRLEAAPKGTSMWTEYNGDPDPEAIELSEAYGWEYRAKRGDFYIYCSAHPGERELNTDPNVQALALHAVRKRQSSTLCSLIFWVAAYFFFSFYTGILLMMIETRSWFFLLGTVLVLWIGIDDLRELHFLHKIQKKLREGMELKHTKDWRKHQKIYYAKHLLRIVLMITWAVLFLHGWGKSVLDEDKQPLSAYPGNPPFATMKDFAGEEVISYEDSRMGVRFDGVKEWNDWLAPHNIKWSEHATIQRKDGSKLEGGLYVDYHETVNSWIAGRLAVEYYRQDAFHQMFHRFGKLERLERLELPDLSDFGIDYAVAYFNQLHFPTVVLQKGNQVIHVTFYQIGENDPLPLESWVSVMAKKFKDS